MKLIILFLCLFSFSEAQTGDFIKEDCSAICPVVEKEDNVFFYCNLLLYIAENVHNRCYNGFIKDGDYACIVTAMESTFNSLQKYMNACTCADNEIALSTLQRDLTLLLRIAHEAGIGICA